MFSLFKKKTTATPAWASFFTTDEYEAFMATIDQYFTAQNIPYQSGDGFITVEDSSFGGDELGLHNIAQLCKQNNITDYAATVQDHFELMKRAKQFNDAFERNAHNFEYVKPYLGIRLYHKSYGAVLDAENTMGADFIGDIFAMLVYDLPNTVLNVKPEQAAHWNKPFDELMAIGLQNINQKYPVSIRTEPVKNAEIYVADADHFFVPNIAFRMADHPELIGSKGSLAGFPHRHCAIFYPIEHKELFDVTGRIIQIISNLNEEGPGSLSKKLFWYNNGDFMEVPYTITGDELEISPPEAFYQMSDTLN